MSNQLKKKPLSCEDRISWNFYSSGMPFEGLNLLGRYLYNKRLLEECKKKHE